MEDSKTKQVTPPSNQAFRRPVTAFDSLWEDLALTSSPANANLDDQLPEHPSILNEHLPELEIEMKLPKRVTNWACL